MPTIRSFYESILKNLHTVSLPNRETIKGLPAKITSFAQKIFGKIRKKKETSPKTAGKLVELTDLEVPVQRVASKILGSDTVKPTTATIATETDRAPPLPKKIEPRPAGGLFTPQGIVEFLIEEKKIDPKIIQEAFTELKEKIPFTKHEGDETWTRYYEIDRQKLDEIGSEITKKMENGDSKKYKTTDKKKATKYLDSLLRGLVERKPVETDEYIQLQGHVNENAFAPGPAASSETQKFAAFRKLANQGFIRNKKTGEIELSRSSRSDTIERIEEKSIADIYSRLTTPAKAGLIEKSDAEGKTYYEYQRADVTFMDRSWTKAAVAKESEKKFIEDKIKAMDWLWSSMNGSVKKDEKGWYILRKFRLDEGGEEIEVREYRPILYNFSFSKMATLRTIEPAKSASGNATLLVGKSVKHARVYNLPSTLFLAEKLRDRMPEEIKKAFPEKKTQNDTVYTTALTEWLNKYLQSCGPVATDENLALRGLLIALTGIDENSTQYDIGDKSDQHYLYTTILLEIAGIPLTLECKSGNDRTAVAIALGLARKQFREKQNKVYGMDYADEEDKKLFAYYFKRNLLDFAVPSLVVSRGVRADVEEKKPEETKKKRSMRNLLKKTASTTALTNRSEEETLLRTTLKAKTSPVFNKYWNTRLPEGEVYEQLERDLARHFRVTDEKG